MVSEIYFKLVEKAKETPRFNPKFCFVGIEEASKLSSDIDFIYPMFGGRLDPTKKEDRNTFYKLLSEGRMSLSTDFGPIQIVSVNLKSMLEIF